MGSECSLINPSRNRWWMAIKQETFTDIEYSFRKKITKREKFPGIMDDAIPWDEWAGVIKPYQSVVNLKRSRKGNSVLHASVVKSESLPGSVFICYGVMIVALYGKS